jgi:hypothetical protein
MIGPGGPSALAIRQRKRHPPFQLEGPTMHELVIRHGIEEIGARGRIIDPHATWRSRIAPLPGRLVRGAQLALA